MCTQVNEVTVLEEMLEEISVVPNPYYAYSQYETNKLDNRVKIVNLPVCTVRIWHGGTLIRTYEKASPLTFVDWIKNGNVPIAGGVYIIHIDVPGVGQAIRKWFGVMRPVDLDMQSSSGLRTVGGYQLMMSNPQTGWTNRCCIGDHRHHHRDCGKGHAGEEKKHFERVVGVWVRRQERVQEESWVLEGCQS